MIAIALSCDPRLVIADEPTTALDVTIQAQILELLNHLKTRINASILLITHDLDTLYAICDRVAVLADRKLLAAAPVAELETLDHPWVQEYFNGPRGRAARDAR